MAELSFPGAPTEGQTYYGENGIIYQYTDGAWEIKGYGEKTLVESSYTPPTSTDFWYSPEKGQILVYNDSEKEWDYVVENSKSQFGESTINLKYPTFPTSDFEDHDYTLYYNYIHTQTIETSAWFIEHDLNSKEIEVVVYNTDDNELLQVVINSEENVDITYATGVSYEIPTVNSVVVDSSEKIIIYFDRKVKGSAFVSSIEYYPENYGIGSKILSTHYRLEFEYNTNPFTDNYIIPKELVTDLYNKWEEFRPVTRVSHYSAKLEIPTDFSGNYIPLYDDPAYDSNFYSSTTLSSNNCENAYIYWRTKSSDTWEVDHGLFSENVIVRVHTSDENGHLKQVIPKRVKIDTKNHVTIEFDEEKRGYAFVLASDYYESQNNFLTTKKTWSITHNLGTKNILYEVYDDVGRKIIPSFFEIIDLNRVKVGLSNNVPGKCLIKNAENGNYYSYEASTSATSWNINHGLNTKNVIFRTYDNNGKAIWPKYAITTDNDTLELTFESAVSGRCVIEASSNYTSFISDDGSLYAIHNLGTKNLIFDAYDENDNLTFPNITYDEQEGSDENTLYLKFSPDNMLERCVILDNVDYVYTNRWIVNHNFEQKYVISQIYYNEGDIDNYVIYPDSVNVVDNNSFEVELYDMLGKAQVANVDESVGYCELGHGIIHKESPAKDTWVVRHHLENLCIILDVYDWDGRKMHPSEYDLRLIDKYKCEIYFSEKKRGHCVIRSIGNTPGPIVESFSSGFLIKLKYEDEQGNISTLYTVNPSISNFSDRIELSFSIPKKDNEDKYIEGYFNTIELYTVKDDILCFKSTGNPIYKHREFVMNYKYIIYYEDIH